MKAVCIIPARYASVRFPGKPLARQTGKFLIQHVYERALEAQCFEQVIVATDDQRILDAVRSFGGAARMTRQDHPSGTDRIAEVAAHLEAEAIVNLQGDEPDIRPRLLKGLVDLLADNPKAEMATLAARFTNAAEVADPNVVKVVVGRNSRALYFSRSGIPFDRAAHLQGGPITVGNYLKHIGLYAYRREFLLQFPLLPQTPLEKLESLEQLRALEHGHTILVAEVDYQSRGIDTPEDYAAFVAEQNKT
ncbi:MAG: 3-deoxy-manno-octulosonate cytidylyltransferase [Anaerolineaceae bacterium]|nr:3-deoxy-manno-octulosonate cytidylyltransferase [Anaerolineaceae bacterium]